MQRAVENKILAYPSGFRLHFACTQHRHKKSAWAKLKSIFGFSNFSIPQTRQKLADCNRQNFGPWLNTLIYPPYPRCQYLSDNLAGGAENFRLNQMGKCHRSTRNCSALISKSVAGIWFGSDNQWEMRIDDIWVWTVYMFALSFKVVSQFLLV